MSDVIKERKERKIARLCPTVAIPQTVARQAPLSMEFSRQEYQSGLSFPSPGGLPDPGIEPRSPALQADALPTVTQEACLIKGCSLISKCLKIFLNEKEVELREQMMLINTNV